MKTLYELALLFLAGHFAAFFFFFRWRPSFKEERTIFFYHAHSAILFSVAVLLPGLLAREGHLFVAGFALVMLHGIYSIVFLEFWSLSQISYSIAILAAVKRRGAVAEEALIGDLMTLGESKKTGRLESLQALALIAFDGARYRLTSRGRMVAGLVRAIRWCANLKDTG